MTCRHVDGDPDCSSYPRWLKKQEREAAADRVEEVEKQIEDLLARTPNPDVYEIFDVQEVGTLLVAVVEYTSCKNCSLDAKKVMVFENTSLKNVVFWKRIDPHFSETNAKDHTCAPPPRARFPATDQGWQDALDFAQHITRVAQR